ncbi:transglutaminase domain-containing protein [Psychroserpens sp. NJDZ02]|uniref:transglutaminase domain-containing protein n=1 Tax=Psychroserpens sp. NJDZ02 TaxID=2570561 RepID=UPI0010A89EB0|nr:transglutaminase domain-containing protein [Psychroserpens sp. NJDZ02]QCE39917.1 hypothetical protein E9099_00200 [Psychroserpens sp. NJDZ02]
MKNTVFITFVSLFFINSVFSQNESIEALIEKTNELNLDMRDLTTFAEENIKDKEELAKFFYYWIGSNIQYDEETFLKTINGEISNEDFWKSQDESVVYNNRTGVCAGYANLYKWFLEWIDIETVVVSGHIRDLRNHYVELETDDSYRHAWNAIKLNDEWILVDTTWGTSKEKETSEFYFNIKPELSIITHYPEDSKWQLLKEPLNLEEFNKSQFVKPFWFMIGFTETPKLMSDQEFYYFTFQNIPENKWSVGLQLSSDNINFNGMSDIKLIEQDGLIYFRFSKDKIPKTAFFKVNLVKFEYVGNDYMKTEHKDVINFKL